MEKIGQTCNKQIGEESLNNGVAGNEDSMETSFKHVGVASKLICHLYQKQWIYSPEWGVRACLVDCVFYHVAIQIACSPAETIIYSFSIQALLTAGPGCPKVPSFPALPGAP